MKNVKEDFKKELNKFLQFIQSHVSTKDGQWAVKGFIDVYKNIYTISSDTKIVSKILEIHLFPKILSLSQFPYNEYLGHFCFGIIYDRVDGSTIDETKSYNIDHLKSITSVVKNFDFFIAEKWKIASDKGGSGNTANIGSINNIEDIKNENGMFSKLGENWFDEYWMNYNKISVKDKTGKAKKIRSLTDFVKYRKGNEFLIVPKKSGRNKCIG
ncbi:MAG: hypothetical protein HY800_06685 [Ignavibacteriales bacterium]|nr:hypothetical protein [Ignavibacteriales bacterium]